MIGSVHIADVGVTTTLRSLGRQPRPRSVRGLRQAILATAAPLSPAVLPTLQGSRLALVAFWDDEGALEAFVAEHPVGRLLDEAGWQARLEPVRMHGAWPGIDDDLPTDRDADHGGAAAVLTLGKLRLLQAPRFLRTSAKAEAAVLDAPGMLWTTGLGRPPYVVSFSLWESSRALATYAYGQKVPAHHDAIDADAAKPFHHRSAFIRFRPYASRGHLNGRNPLAESLLETAPDERPV
jgi:hypothetical protein